MADLDLSVVLQANRLLLADAEERLARVTERETGLMAALDRCATEKREILREKDALEIADRLYRRRFFPRGDDDAAVGGAPMLGVEHTEKKPRARVGPQRYRMLARLREWKGFAEIDEISNATGLTAKRIRDQLRSDVPEGIIQERDGKYTITPTGLDLLDRFERYKMNKGEPLPSLDGPADDEEADDPSVGYMEHEENIAA